MSKYNLGLSLSSHEKQPNYSLGLNYQSILNSKLLPNPTILKVPPDVEWALFKEVQKQYEDNKTIDQRVIESVVAVLNFDLAKVDSRIIELIAKSLQSKPSNYKKTPAESLEVHSFPLDKPLSWIGLPSGYSLLIGLDHKNQLKAFGLSVKEFSAGDNLKIKLDLMYDNRSRS